MYYQQLKIIWRSKKFEDSTIAKLDEMFFFLAHSHRDRIQASWVSTRVGIKYDAAVALLNDCVDVGILVKRYAIDCPICYDNLKIVDNLDQLNQIFEEGLYCEECHGEENENPLKIRLENVSVIYKLVAQAEKKNDFLC